LEVGFDDFDDDEATVNGVDFTDNEEEVRDILKLDEEDSVSSQLDGS